MQNDNNRPAIHHVPSEVAGKECKTGGSDKEKSRDQSNHKTAATDAFNKQLKKGGFDNNRQS